MRPAPGRSFMPLAARLRAGLGPFRTVFGVKKIADRLSFEFYFYDYARLEREVSIARVLDILAPFVACPLAYPEGRPYFMFSLDLDDEIAGRRRPLEMINVYVGNPGSSVSSGICYELTGAGLRLANFYFFFDARKEMDEIVAKVACSAHHDLRALAGCAPSCVRSCSDCRVIVVANKKVQRRNLFLPDRDRSVGRLSRARAISGRSGRLCARSIAMSSITCYMMSGSTMWSRPGP